MNIIFDLKKIASLIKNFYKLTNLVVTFCDSTFNHLTSSEICSSFCGKVTRKYGKFCQQCDLYNLINAKKSKEPTIYTCHAGIVESILPIRYNDLTIAYILVGQYRDKEEKYSSAEKMLSLTEKYDLDKNELLEQYEKLPVISEEQIGSMFKLLTSFTKLMWKEGMIRNEEDSLCTQINSYIDAHLTENIQVETLCNEFFVSRNTLYKIFQKNFNMSITKYILQKRLNYAQQLLKNTAMSVTDISGECGFLDNNYFIRMFKKNLGVSPLQFRKHINN